MPRRTAPVHATAGTTLRRAPRLLATLLALLAALPLLPLLPALLLLRGKAVTGAALACAGIVLNRFVLTIQTLALPTLPFDPFLSYWPSWQEYATSFKSIFPSLLGSGLQGLSGPELGKTLLEEGVSWRAIPATSPKLETKIDAVLAPALEKGLARYFNDEGIKFQ